MAFDKNNTSTFQKVVIVLFAVILVLSMCLPFFSSCSMTSGSSSTSDDASSASTSSTTASTTADIQASYASLLASLKEKVAADASNTTAIVSLGNNYMDLGMALLSASDVAENEGAAAEALNEAISYYDLYLLAVPADDSNVNPVTVDRIVCLYYAGEEETAIAELEAFTEAEPDYLMGWYNLGAFYYMQADYENAKAAYNKVIELDPEGENSATLYAQIYLSLIDSIEAAAEEEATASEGEDTSDAATADDSTAATADDAAENATAADEPAAPDDGAEAVSEK